MRIVIFTMLCFVISHTISGQLDCVSDTTKVELNVEGKAVISALDFLTNQNSEEEYVISFNEEESKKLVTLDVDNIGINTYLLTEVSTGNTCNGIVIVVLDLDNENSPPVPVCVSRIKLNLDSITQLSINDINDGTWDDQTNRADLIFSLSTEYDPNLKPSNDNFESIAFIEFSTDDLCKTEAVFLDVWDGEGLRNTCMVDVLIIDNQSTCNFLICVDVVETVAERIDFGGFSFIENLPEGEYTISVDGGEAQDRFITSLDDVGTYNIIVTQISSGSQCSANLTLMPLKDQMQSFACLDEVTVLLDDNGLATIFAIDMLEGENLINDNYTINLDSADRDVSWINLFSVDVGTRTYVITEKATENMCWGTLIVTTTDGLRNHIEFDNITIDQNGGACITVLGTTDVPLVSLQTGIAWDPSIIQYSGIEETGTLTGITVNDSDIEQGELKFLWLVGFQEDPVLGQFGFEICFNAVGESGEGTLINFVNLPNFSIEAASAQGVTFPFSLQGGSICIDTCPDVINCQDNCGGRAEVADGEIPLYINLSNVSKDETVIRFSLNEEEATIYDQATYGLPQRSIIPGTNELSIENSTGSILNGISTLDLVMTLQYLLGLESLMPHQIIAADIDKSGDVSLTKDITKMSNLILGIDNDIDGSNWFFIPESEAFEQPFDFNGFDFVNDFSKYNFLDTDINTSVGINVDVYKYGDLNRNFAYNRSNESGLLNIENDFIAAYTPIDIQIKLTSEDIESFVGAQAALKIENSTIINIEHEYGSSMSHHIESGQLKFTWISGEPVEDIEFALKIETAKDGYTSDFISLDETFATEFITRDLQVFDINLNLSDITSPIAEIDINQFYMYPNPATESFTVEVHSRLIGKDLRILNTLGQLEYTMVITNQLTQINRQSLPSTGIKLIQVDGIPSQKLLIH